LLIQQQYTISHTTTTINRLPSTQELIITASEGKPIILFFLIKIIYFLIFNFNLNQMLFYSLDIFNNLPLFIRFFIDLLLLFIILVVALRIQTSNDPKWLSTQSVFKSIIDTSKQIF
jgi:hypothetical protein